MQRACLDEPVNEAPRRSFQGAAEWTYEHLQLVSGTAASKWLITDVVNSMLRGRYTRAGFLDLSYQPATPSQRHETETSAHCMLCRTTTKGNSRVGTRTRYLLGPRTLCNEASNGVGRVEHHDGSTRHVQNPTRIQLDCSSDRSIVMRCPKRTRR